MSTVSTKWRFLQPQILKMHFKSIIKCSDFSCEMLPIPGEWGRKKKTLSTISFFFLYILSWQSKAIKMSFMKPYPIHGLTMVKVIRRMITYRFFLWRCCCSWTAPRATFAIWRQSICCKSAPPGWLSILPQLCA